MNVRIACWAAAVLACTASSLVLARGADDPGRYGWLIRYASTDGAVSDPRFAALARATTPPFDLHDGIRRPRLADRFLSGLGGPPDPVRIVDDRYLVLGACTPHDCGTKSLLWIDPVDDVRIGAVAGVSYDDHRTSLLVFSRSTACERLPAAFHAALSQWIANFGMIVVRSGFVGPDAREGTSCLKR